MAMAILFTLLPFSFAFRGGEVTFFMLRDQPESALLLLVGAVGLWLQLRVADAVAAHGRALVGVRGSRVRGFE